MAGIAKKAKKESKKAGNNRKKGRAERPGQKAKRARSLRGLYARKAKHVRKSNGPVFFAVWDAAWVVAHKG
jgi:hypothetical protein